MIFLVLAMKSDFSIVPGCFGHYIMRLDSSQSCFLACGPILKCSIRAGWACMFSSLTHAALRQKGGLEIQLLSLMCTILLFPGSDLRSSDPQSDR